MIILMQICYSEHIGIRAGIPSVLDIAAMPMRAVRWPGQCFCTTGLSHPHADIRPFNLRLALVTTPSSDAELCRALALGNRASN